MGENTAFVGLDVHKETIAVAVAEDRRGGEVRYLGEIENTREAVRKLVRKLTKAHGTLHFCYEAGPCGYGIHRQLTEMGHDCELVAPGRFIVNRIVRPRLTCACCDRFIQAPLPSRPIERGRPGPGLLAHVLVGNRGGMRHWFEHPPEGRSSSLVSSEPDLRPRRP